MTVTDVTKTVPGSPFVSPAPTASDRKLSQSPYPYLYMGTVQETRELDFSDFEKAGGVKKGIFTEATGKKHPRELDDIA